MHDRQTLTAQLKALNLPSDRPLMVHAGLRSIGAIDGGADTLIDALLDAIAPGGTMLMMVAEMGDVPFDPLTTPADPENGMLAEIFRRRAGNGVSDHPASRFAAIGPDAPALLSPVPLHDYYGPGSPLERFVAKRGQVLRLGASPDTVTVTHYAEYLADLPVKRRVRRDYFRADTGPLTIDSLDDSDGIAVWPGGDYFAQILRDFVGNGHARTGPVGNCTAELLDGPGFVAFATEWMERELG
ncbi:aminoglycoside N(3)-acetyltransferase [Sphingomonas sp. AX6]|uniref:aminoglycoside N(3)-acetyltransferase n=1 Tax=Sphingomonas sp. AX6 TaxID=2653171 RepID=UPI0012F35926|nr:AAC(3) family N-acetyltransferase [Sphingomonas sp. AX6]VXC86521.1 Aminoglycoside N(3)-acetyltransferase [Sphingomonas sp. AX6]